MYLCIYIYMHATYVYKPNIINIIINIINYYTIFIYSFQ